MSGIRVSLVFHHTAIHVSGRNLAPLVVAIGDHVAAALEEYRPELFDVPGEGEPVIEGVEVEAGKAMEDWRREWLATRR